MLKIFDLHAWYRVTTEILLLSVASKNALKKKKQLKFTRRNATAYVVQQDNSFLDSRRNALRRTRTRRGVAEIMLVYYSRFAKISCTRNRPRYDLQSAGETSSLVPQQRRLGWPAHQDQLLVGQHHDAGKGREPHSQVNESLVGRLIVIYYRYEPHTASLLNNNKCLPGGLLRGRFSALIVKSGIPVNGESS